MMIRMCQQGKVRPCHVNNIQFTVKWDNWAHIPFRTTWHRDSNRFHFDFNYGPAGWKSGSIILILICWVWFDYDVTEYAVFQKELYNGIQNVTRVTNTFTLKSVQTIHRSRCWTIERLHFNTLNETVCTPLSVNVWWRNTYRSMERKSDGKRPLRRPRRRWVDNIRMDLGEVGWGGID
jgi:hypothetical protein